MYEKSIADNGLTVIASPMKDMASVSLSIWIGVGGRYEAPKESGISHFLEHMLFKGTFTRTAKQLKEAVEGIGGAFNGFTADEVTCYMVKVPAKYAELGADVLADMVLNARLDEEDVKKEKFVICEEIKMYRDQPADHVLDLLGEVMWPGNALGRPLTGTISTVKALNGKKLADFRRENYHPANIAVIAAGKVDTEKLFGFMAERFKGEKKRQKPSFKKARPGQKALRMKILPKKINQTHIAMGFLAPDSNITERIGMKLMNVIFGGNMSSRLFDHLRENKGLCYDIASSYKRHSDIGELHIHAGVDKSKTGESIAAIIDEVQRMRDSKVSADELVRAKEYVKGQFELAMESTAARMMWLGDRFMVHDHIPEVRDVIKQINSITAGMIHELSGKVFRGSLLNLAMIGDIRLKDRNGIRRELARL